MGAVVDDSPKDFAAGAIGDGVVDHQGGVTVLGALEQVDAVDVELGALALQREKALEAADRAAAGHVEQIVFGLGANSDNARRDIRGISAIGHQPYMRQVYPVAD